jgi:4-hydroxybutyrate CoA-transferase
MQYHRDAAEALQYVRSGMRVFVQGGAATPRALLRGLVESAGRLRDVELMHLHVEGLAEHAEPRHARSFRVVNLFVGANVRGRLDYDRVDYLPCFLSEIPALFRSGQRPIDVALIHVSPPDANGFCSLGVSVDVALAATQTARSVIAQVNPRMPRVHGDGFIHISAIHHAVEVDEPLPEPAPHRPTAEERKIGEHVASLIQDGSTLQIGIGAIPDAALASLRSHRNLGLHTEMWSDGALELIECGAIDNSLKRVHRGKSVSGFAMGSRRLYDFMNDNPSVIQLGIDYVNSPPVIARNPRVAAINSAVQVDLTGQVCADSIGNRIVSGVGGQMDFMRGAALSEGGKPIIALTSRTRDGKPRLVPMLEPGAGVVTTRAHVRYVVTEHGIADLFGRTLRERARELARIAHPEDREGLERAWVDLHKTGPSS